MVKAIKNCDEKINRNNNKTTKPTLQIESNDNSNNNKVTTVSPPRIVTLKETRVTCLTNKKVITSFAKGVVIQPQKKNLPQCNNGAATRLNIPVLWTSAIKVPQF